MQGGYSLLPYGQNVPLPGSQINWESPQAQTLKACWNFTESTGQLINDLALRNAATLFSVGTNQPNWRPPQGVYFNSSSPSNYTYARVPNSTLITAGSFSWTSRFLVTSASGFFMAYNGVAQEACLGFGPAAGITGAIAHKAFGTVYTAAAGLQTAVSATNCDDGLPHLAVMTVDKSRSLLTLYLDGRAEGTRSITGSWSTEDDYLFFGANGNGHNAIASLFGGVIFESRIYWSCLPTGTVADIYANPGDLYLPPLPARTWFLPITKSGGLLMRRRRMAAGAA